MLLHFYTRNYDCVNSGFCRAVQENCALLGNYAACSGNSLPPSGTNLSAPYSRIKNPRIFLTLEDGTGKLSRNVGKELPLHAA